MPTVIGIKFRANAKCYYFSPKDIVFEVGEGAIVETARGTEYGEVTLANCEVPESEIRGELKSVIRKATQKDVDQHKANEEKRPKCIRDAQALANKRNLDMKIVDAEFTFDNSKVILYFTSDNRIDFRDLVKDLATAFHMRIELRQIGIRDECKMKGGLGPCGRVCCCKAYMNDFERVSIKMAKHQGLSLNPTKISGLCGRLMCCLSFEDKYYADTLKFMPKVNSEIDTPNGRGIVESVDMLRQTVVVKFVAEDETAEFAEFNLEQLGITPVYPQDETEATEADMDDENETLTENIEE